MNKKKNNTSKFKHPAVKKPQVNVVIAEANNYWQQRAVVVTILLLACIALFPALKNSFVWDDDIYIVKNQLITDLSWKGIVNIFTNFKSDNYAPVTVLINAVQYSLGGLDPTVFHLGSLGFHLLNITLVYWFIRLLSGNPVLPAITALLFAIHPIQVESIAWASGGSTLYCAAFSLLSFITYMYFLKENKKKFFFSAILFFALATLSKLVGIMIPVAFLLLDYMNGRKMTFMVYLEKLPMLMFSVALLVLNIVLKDQDRSAFGAIGLPFYYHLILACYGYITYFIKLLMPIHLSAFYSYPVNPSTGIPYQYYIYVLLIIALAVLVFYSRRFNKKIIFGVGFFTIMVFLVLQLKPVGGSLIADRYVYVPSIGLFYLIAEGLYWMWKKSWKIPAVLFFLIFTVFISVKTYARCSVWKNAITLWNDVISHDSEVPIAYYNRGIFLLKDEKDTSAAMADYSKAIELKPDYLEAYNNRGVIYMNEKKYNEALDDYKRALDLKSKEKGKKLFESIPKNEINENYAHTCNFRGVVYLKEKKYDLALEDFSKAIELKPDFANAYYNRGLIYYMEGKYGRAVSDYSKAIELKVDYAEAYFNRGLAEYYCNQNNVSCEDLQQAAALGNQQAAEAMSQICK